MAKNDDDDHDIRWAGRSIPRKHWHFHRQLHARYGIIMAPGEFSEMLRDIKNGRAQLVEQISPTKAIYSVVLRRTWDRFFVLVEKGHVVTAMPPTKRLKKKRREMPE